VFGVALTFRASLVASPGNSVPRWLERRHRNVLARVFHRRVIFAFLRLHCENILDTVCSIGRNPIARLVALYTEHTNTDESVSP